MPKQIMIIEDDADILDIMTFILKDKGYEVTSSINSSIMEQVTENFPDLILLDNRLPEGLGIEICKRYKAAWKEEGKAGCPVVIISADHEIKNKAASYDADGFLEKPFDVNVFTDMVGNYIKK